MPLIDHNDGYALLIGRDPKTGRPRYYADERGLVTIGPPGSGKTQSHILPNLLTYRGPAIVLDVTGELWATTSKERSRFGPVYKIDTENPDQSDHYNPFSFIRSDPKKVWGDAMTFASLLYSQQGFGSDGRGGSFFAQAAPQYLATMASLLALKVDLPYRQNCDTMLRYVSGLSFDAFMEQAKASDILAIRATASMLERADKDTRGNVEWTAKNSLRPFEDPEIAAISRVSDWHPAAIRQHNATVYLCIALERIVTSPGYVRLILGQHLYELMRPGDAVDRARPVQLFVDEAPQLRQMDVLLQAIEVGRNHGLRVWMAMQWKGQLTTAYGKETAEGMIGACGLQAYLNPPLIDGTADDVSRQIGGTYHRADTIQRPKVTPQALGGRDYRDKVVAFDHGDLTELVKHPLHEDPALMKRVGASP